MNCLSSKERFISITLLYQWANSCCSHPKPHEDTLQAAQRRLNEELGFITPLTHVGSFTYHAEVSGGLIEHEYDHLYVSTIIK